MKDALKRAGLAKQEPAPQKISKEFREELPDDESLPPRFEAPAMTVAVPLGQPSPRPPVSAAPAADAEPEAASPEDNESEAASPEDAEPKIATEPPSSR